MKYKCIASVPLFVEFYFYSDEENRLDEVAKNIASNQFLSTFIERSNPMSTTKISDINMVKNSIQVIKIENVLDTDTGL